MKTNWVDLGTTITGSYMECEIIHTLSDTIDITKLAIQVGVDVDNTRANHLTTSELSTLTYSGTDYDLSLKFDSTQLDCELTVNETSESDNKFKLVVWNVPNSSIITIGDIVKLKLWSTPSMRIPYSVEGMIDAITNDDDGNKDSKLTITGTTLIDSALRNRSIQVNEVQNTIVTLDDLFTYIYNKFQLVLIVDTNYDSKYFKAFIIERSVSMLLDEFCNDYNTKNKTDKCIWYIDGLHIIISDFPPAEIDMFIINIRYNDIIDLKTTEDTNTQRSIKIQVVGLPSIHKNSLLSIIQSVDSEYNRIIADFESFIVTEVEHIFSTTSGFYSNIYCYTVKPLED